MVINHLLTGMILQVLGYPLGLFFVETAPMIQMDDQPACQPTKTIARRKSDPAKIL